MNNIKDFSALIFLDIDGVLNDDVTLYKISKDIQDEGKAGWAGGENDDEVALMCSRQIIPEFVSNLNILLNKFNLGIVLSSTWRRAELTRNAVALGGIDRYEERLIGCTPLHSEFGGHRGAEIHDWIINNKYNGDFIILDDDGDMEPYMDHLVQTKWNNGGLNKEAMDRAIKYLESFQNKA